MEIKTLIIYKTRHQTTEKYARWIRQEVECDIINVDKIDTVNIDEYGIIVFGSWIYEDKIRIAPFIEENWKKFENKKLILFCNGITNRHDEKMDKILKDSLPQYIIDQITFFPLGGDVSFYKLKWYEKLKLKSRKKFRETHESDKILIQPIVVKIYEMRTFAST